MTGASLSFATLMKLFIVMPSRTMAQTVTAATTMIGTSGSGSPQYAMNPVIPKAKRDASASAHMVKKMYRNTFMIRISF